MASAALVTTNRLIRRTKKDALDTLDLTMTKPQKRKLNKNNNENINQNICKVNKKRGGDDENETVPAKKPKLDSKLKMFQTYQPWVIKTYGDLSKTKTVTLRKYARILRALRGEEVNSADSSKFRFWVKSKGFHIGKPVGYDAKPADGIVGRFTTEDIDKEDLSDKDDYGSDLCAGVNQDPALYIPTPPVKNAVTPSEPVYRKVAIVENFFDIIYNVHVELEGRPGKHAGQKRTYRTITETYAFLPREAVTRFLLGCTDCQKRPRTPSPLNVAPPKPSNFTSIADLSKSTITSTSTPQDLSIDKNRHYDYQKSFEETLQINKIHTTHSTPKKSNPLDVSNLTANDPPKIFSTPKKRYLGPLRTNLKNEFEKVDDSSSFDSSSLKSSVLSHFRSMESNIDLNLPITTTYLKHMRTLGYSDEDALKFERYVSDIFIYNTIMMNTVPEFREVAVQLHGFLSEILRQIHF